MGRSEGAAREQQRRGITRNGQGVWAVAPLGLLGFLDQGVSFSSAGFLWAAVSGVIMAAAWMSWAMIKRLSDARRLSPASAPKSFRGWWGKNNMIVRTGSFLLALLLIGVSMADPRGGARDERVNFGGKDVEVLVDVSHSTVYAEDGRYERMRGELREFISRLQGTDRVGLVVFAGQARTASPLSVDYSNFGFKIDRLDVESRGLSEGSDLAGAVRFAAERFDLAKKLGERDRIMIVISDGDVSDAEIAKAIEAAQQHKVTVYAIGVGSPAGSRIMVPTVDGRGTQPLVDSRTGQPAMTRLVEGPLRTLSERTGGAYFRAGDSSSIDRVLREVAAREQGERGDVIKSPSPIGSYLLWPALALLLAEMLMVPASVLTRPKKAKKEEKEKPSGPRPSSLNGFAALGLATFIPLGAWPQILPFALLGTAVAALLAVEAWTGGKMTRSVVESWQRRSGFVADGVARDLALIYELRAADESQLTAFLGAWRAAKEEERPALIREAAADETLWRQKLTAAFLAGNPPETAERLLSALTRAGRVHLEPLTPIVERAASHRGKLAWTNHSDAAERFERLRALTSGLPLAPPEPAAPAARKLSWRERFNRGVTVSLLAVMMAASVGAGVGTWQFSQQQAAAREQADRIFFAEDQFVFNDRYIDPRIPELVLPALRRWYSSSSGDQAAMELALQVLRESPDPKADNILILLFKRGDVIALSGRAQTMLLTSLMERENDEVWVLMERAIAESGERPGAGELLKKLVMIGAELGTEKAFTNLFHVLKSPDPEVRRLASETLYGSLTDPARAALFFDRLQAVRQKFADDPILQLWTAQFALRHLQTLPASSPLNEQARDFFDKVLAVSHTFNIQRAQALAAGAAANNGQMPDIPAFLPSLIGMVEQMERAAAGPDGSRPIPPSLQGVSRYIVNEAVTMLIMDGEKLIPGLHERLVADGVVNPDEGGYDEGYDDEREIRGYYPQAPQKDYRDSYKLSHLRKLAAALQELGAAAVGEGRDVPPALLEYLTRAGASLEPLMNAGRLSGMLEGGSAGEAAAEALFPTLKEGVAQLGERFLFALRGAGLAPAVGDPLSLLAYPESLDAAGLARVRGLLAERVSSGQGWNDDGSARPLSWSEKVYLAKALAAVDDAIRGGPAAPASDDEFFTAIRAAGEESIALARLYAAAEARKTDAAYLLRAEAAMLERAAAAPGRVTDEELQQGLTRLFELLRSSGKEADAWTALARAVSADPRNEGLRRAALTQVNAATRDIAEQARKTLGGSFAERLFLEGLMLDANSYRREFNQRHIAALRAALEQSRLSAVGPAVQAARRIVPRLDAGYRAFPGTVFLDELRARGFALDNAQTSVDLAYPRSYSREEVQRMLDWAKQHRAAGVTREGDGGSTRPFDAEERRILDALANTLQDVLSRYPASGRMTQAQREAFFSPEERALFARAALLGTVLEAASAAGVPRAEAPGERAAEVISGWLHRGYFVFPGQTFLLEMRAAGFALANNAVDREGAYPKSYTRSEVERLHRYLMDFRARGVTRDGALSRPINERERQLLDSMIAEVGKLLQNDSAAPGGSAARALLGLPLLAAAPVLPVSWLIMGGLLFAGVFAAWALWAARGAVDEASERPSVAASARFKRLEIAAQRLAKSAQWGAFRSRAKGDGGLEYAESREFEPGDTLRDVDWNEYAQTGELRTKVYDQEREMPLMLVVDLSKSGGFSTQGRSKAQIIEDVAATLAFTAGRTNMRVGAVLFTDRVEAVIPPAGGAAHAWRVAQAVVQAAPEGRGTDLRAGLDAAVKAVKTRAVIAVLSDFLSDADFKEALGAAGARHDLRLIRVADPAELRSLPDAGLVSVEDAETGAGRLLDTSSPGVRRDAAAAVARREARIEDSFAAVRTQPIVLSTEGDPLDELAVHFQPKGKTAALQPD